MELCFHFQNVKGFVSVVFSFSKKHNCKQRFEHSLQIALLMRLWINNEIYIKLLNLFQLSRVYNLLYIKKCLGLFNLTHFDSAYFLLQFVVQIPCNIIFTRLYDRFARKLYYYHSHLSTNSRKEKFTLLVFYIHVP